jgi:molecular chaperone HscB
VDPEAERALRAEFAAMAERLRGQTYFEMLGLDREADEEAVHSAYDDLAARMHPDRFHSSSDSVRQLAREVFELLTRAHDTLVDPRRRGEYLIQLRKGERNEAERRAAEVALDAEISFQRGEAKLRARDYEGALECFGESLQRQPEEGEYHAHYGWALYLCHPDEEAMVHEAIEHVRRGVKLARDREKPYLYLGRLYKAIGRTAAAEKMFTRAVQIRPDSVESLRELRVINMRRGKSKGLLGRLLRR